MDSQPGRPSTDRLPPHRFRSPDAPAEPVTAAASAKKKSAAPAKPVTAATSVKKKNATAAASSRAAAPSATTAAANEPNQSGIKYRGVKFDKKMVMIRQFVAIIGLRGTRRYLGGFITAEQAARAYDSAGRKYLKNPICNFHEDGTLNPDRHSRGPHHRLTPAGWAQVERVGPRRRSKSSFAASGSGADMAVNGAIEEDGERLEEAEGDEREEAIKEDGEEEEVVVVEEGKERATTEEEPTLPPPLQQQATPLRPQCQQQATPLQPQQQCDHSQPAASTAAVATAPVTASVVHRPASAEVWVELKAAVFRKLMSVDGPALSEDEARKYKRLSSLLNKPTPSLRSFVEDVVPRSGFSAEVADRAAGLLAGMAGRGEFDD